MSFVLLGILNSQAAAGGAAAVYRFQSIGNTGTGQDVGEKVVIDSSGNAYGIGFEDTDATSRNFYLVQYNADGTIGFERRLGDPSGGNDTGEWIAIDNSDNLYVSGILSSTADEFPDGLLAKYNTSGAIQWQRTFSAGFQVTTQQYGVATDSNGDVYILGRENSDPANFQAYLAKYNSSGTLQWQRGFGGAGTEEPSGITTDSSNNVYIVMTSKSTSALDAGVIAKYNSSGTLQWQRNIDEQSSFTDVAVDSAGDVYISGLSPIGSAGSWDFRIVKYNSSGVFQWTQLLGGANFDRAEAITVDANDDVVLVGRAQSAGSNTNYAMVIAKYNSAGTIQWQRYIEITGGDSVQGYGVTTNESNDIFAYGQIDYVTSGQDHFLAVIPGDGSLTGTYVLNSASLVFGAGSLTTGSGGLTSETPSLTSSTTSFTSATSTVPEASLSLTSHTVEL